ncbi:hypothetical protein FI667_g3892, partial [Globisporangium splendens]
MAATLLNAPKDEKFNLTPQAITTLEHQANVLLAEICVVTSPTETNRKLWRKRLARAERCIYVVEQALESKQVAIEHEWHCRLFKSKYLLMEISNIERSVKDRQMLEMLCSAISKCAELDKGANSPQAAELASSTEFKNYFLEKLRKHLVKLHATSILAKNSENSEIHSGFLQHVQYVQKCFPHQYDAGFQLWLIEVACHAYAASFYFGGGHESSNAIRAADDFFKTASLHSSASREMRAYHLVTSGFYFLRTGEVKKISPILDEIKALQSAPDVKPTGILKEPYLDSIVDGLKLNVMACHDPCEALTLSMKAIHHVQTNLQTYASNKSIRMMLVATLFDMLYLHCRLQAQQCRYFEFGLSISQMIQLFSSYKSILEPTIFYKFFVARCHIAVAKYAVSIGRVKETVFNVNYVVEKLLPPIAVTATSYPDSYLSVWVEALDVLMYCGSAADPSFSGSSLSGLQVRQICPNAVLLEFGARILEMEGLRNLIYNGCSVELRAKAGISIAKCISLSNALTTHLETTAEIMALFGPKLLDYGKTDSGEETLKNAIRIALHGKNILLQSRLLVEIFRLYSVKHLVDAQATTAEKYEKKVKLLQKRIAQARAEKATSKLILKWKSGDLPNNNSNAANAKP